MPIRRGNWNGAFAPGAGLLVGGGGHADEVVRAEVLAVHPDLRVAATVLVEAGLADGAGGVGGSGCCGGTARQGQNERGNGNQSTTHLGILADQYVTCHNTRPCGGAGSALA